MAKIIARKAKGEAEAGNVAAEEGLGGGQRAHIIRQQTRAAGAHKHVVDVHLDISEKSVI